MPRFGVEGERIGYQEHGGPVDAPLLFLVHGFTASSASFFENIPGLCSAFRVVTIELLGHGESDAPDDPALYAPDPAVARLAALIGAFSDVPVLLCGHSLGGALCLRLALDRPGLLAGLVILNSNSAAGDPAWRDSVRPRMGALAASIRANGIQSLKGTRLDPAQGTRLPAVARDALAHDFDRLSPAGVAGTAEALTIDVNACERLGELATPTLVVIGDRDRDFVQAAPEFVSRMPAGLVETLTIEGGGHAANLEQPEVFNEALLSFANRIGYLGAGGALVPVTDAPPAADDDDLGPTLYQEIGGAIPRPRRQLLATVLGGGLIAGGAALLVAAFMVGSGGGSAELAAVADPTRTPTPLELSAGARTAAPGTPTVPSASSPASPPASATEPGATQPAATPTPSQPTPKPTATSAPANTPAAEPTSAPTSPPPPPPTQSGPFVSVSGPSAADVGVPVTFVSQESPGAITRSISASNGASASHSPALIVTFAEPGCYSVTVTAVFPSGSISASMSIAVGGATC